jgi:hypothetical protein
VDHLDDPVGRAGQQLALGQADDGHDQAPEGGRGDQAHRHPGPVARAAMVHSPEHEQDAEELVQVDQAEALPVQKMTPRTSWTTQTTRMAIWMAGDGGACCSFRAGGW